MNAQVAYEELIRRTREEALLASCIELLGWDELTYMPSAGGAHRGNQLALLSGLYHERATDPRIDELLAILEGSDLTHAPLSPAAVNIREIRRAYDREIRLPRALVEEMARVTTRAEHEWEVARREADYRIFEPWLARVVALKREEADALGYDTVPYDALLEEYEPGARSADLEALFAELRAALIPLAETLTHADNRADVGILQRDYPLDRQRSFGAMVANKIGFDFRKGRLDNTVHPFSSAIGPGDTRITTRYHPRCFSEGLFSILHELGHAFYEQGLDPEHHGTPMGAVPSLGLHESQARLWENIVGRSRAFWDHFFPKARAAFPEALSGITTEEFHRGVNHVEPTLIRVGADEVTYNLHILARFDLERALLSGDLTAADVPAAWNEAYRHYLGVVPRNDAEGCLQDGHWGSGLIGYFPTYTLGNLFAAQMYDRAAADLGNLDEQFARGQFNGLLNWLRTHVHRHGHRYSAAQLIEHVTGSAPDYRPFVQSLQRKYAALFLGEVP